MAVWAISSGGSAPRARGAGRHDRPYRADRGTIPAGAGSSPSTAEHPACAQRSVVERAFRDDIHEAFHSASAQEPPCMSRATAAVYSKNFRSSALRPRSVQSPYRASSGLTTIHSPGR